MVAEQFDMLAQFTDLPITKNVVYNYMIQNIEHYHETNLTFDNIISDLSYKVCKYSELGQSIRDIRISERYRTIKEYVEQYKKEFNEIYDTF